MILDSHKCCTFTSSYHFAICSHSFSISGRNLQYFRNLGIHSFSMSRRNLVICRVDAQLLSQRGGSKPASQFVPWWGTRKANGGGHNQRLHQQERKSRIWKRCNFNGALNSPWSLRRRRIGGFAWKRGKSSSGQKFMQITKFGRDSFATVIVCARFLWCKLGKYTNARAAKQPSTYGKERKGIKTLF